ncbi:CAP domain-containing protein [Cellulomonas cellasea]|uniref:SCP domain-containing protein n=2 Tax=Cellulomonas cellasea TaxID=43670 RepID=A0A0A0BDA3_9CELL|nr:CAP domain-containing protein [Cellulomonas cellasea]KGM03311.1 hypothetical protein Q760_06640 [Cellulomonas cellasea DSM 20118]GEA86560.1 hypothetical protein CCE01nite_05090 [Cellulomonas cellasea]
MNPTQDTPLTEPRRRDVRRARVARARRHRFRARGIVVMSLALCTGAASAWAVAPWQSEAPARDAGSGGQSAARSWYSAYTAGRDWQPGHSAAGWYAAYSAGSGWSGWSGYRHGRWPRPVHPRPTPAPTATPSPTIVPTIAPEPTAVPTVAPTPTAAPTAAPTPLPTNPGTAPTASPAPTRTPAPAPTRSPRPTPTSSPSAPGTTPPPVATPAPTTPGLTPDQQYAATLVTLTNQQRAAAGLPALAVSDCATQQAVARAALLVAENRFEHDPLGPILTACRARSVGENIALGYPTPAAMMTGWMNSEGHRANILRSYTSVGIGCVSGPRGMLCAQVFVS